MKKITLIVPDNYADVISVTVIGEAGTETINIKATVVDITSVKAGCEIDVMDGVIIK